MTLSTTDQLGLLFAVTALLWNASRCGSRITTISDDPSRIPLWLYEGSPGNAVTTLLNFVLAIGMWIFPVVAFFLQHSPKPKVAVALIAGIAGGVVLGDSLAKIIPPVPYYFLSLIAFFVSAALGIKFLSF